MILLAGSMGAKAGQPCIKKFYNEKDVFNRM